MLKATTDDTVVSVPVFSRLLSIVLARLWTFQITVQFTRRPVSKVLVLRPRRPKLKERIKARAKVLRIMELT